MDLKPFRRTDIHSRFETIFEEFMDDLLNNFNTDFTTRHNVGYPKIDIQETPEKFILDATVPGLTKEDIVVEILEENDIRYISLRGNKQTPDGALKNLLKKEIHRSSFCRNISLPENVDEDSINATVQNGILTIELTKKTKEKILPKKKVVSVK